MCHKSIAINKPVDEDVIMKKRAHQPIRAIVEDGVDYSNMPDHAFAITDLYKIDVHGANEYATPDISLKFHVMMKRVGWLHTEVSLSNDEAYELGKHLIAASERHKAKVEQFGRSLAEQ